jgi:hypothetical protein
MMGSPFTVTVIGGGSGAAAAGGADAVGGETSCAGAGKAEARNTAAAAADRARLNFVGIFIFCRHLISIRTVFVFIGFISAERDTAEKVQYNVYAESLRSNAFPWSA